MPKKRERMKGGEDAANIPCHKKEEGINGNALWGEQRRSSGGTFGDEGRSTVKLNRLLPEQSLKGSWRSQRESPIKT